MSGISLRFIVRLKKDKGGDTTLLSFIGELGHGIFTIGQKALKAAYTILK